MHSSRVCFKIMFLLKIMVIHDEPLLSRLQNSPYFCVFKYARAVKQKVTAHFTDFFTDFKKKNDCFAVYYQAASFHYPATYTYPKGGRLMEGPLNIFNTCKSLESTPSTGQYFAISLVSKTPS